MKVDADIPEYLHATFHELMGIIREGLIRDGHVQLYQFGSFKLSWTKPRKMKNKKTGESYYSKPQPKVVFSPAKHLREMIHPDPQPVVPLQELEQAEKPQHLLSVVPPMVTIDNPTPAANDVNPSETKPSEIKPETFPGEIESSEIKPREIKPGDIHAKDKNSQDIPVLENSPIKMPSMDLQKVSETPSEESEKQETTTPVQGSEINRQDELSRAPSASRVSISSESSTTPPPNVHPKQPRPWFAQMAKRRSTKTVDISSEKIIPQYYHRTEKSNKKWLGLLALVPLMVMMLQTEFTGHYPGMEKDAAPQQSEQRVEKESIEFAEESMLTREDDPSLDQIASNTQEVVRSTAPITWYDASNDEITKEATTETAASSEVSLTEEDLQKFYQEPVLHPTTKGDNLWSLAEKYYGDPYLWPYIYRANDSLQDPDKLQVGKKLVIPGLQHAPEYFSARDKQAVAESYFLLYQQYQKKHRDNAHYFLIGAYRYHAKWLMTQKRHIVKKDLKRAVFWGGRLLAKEQ